MLIIKLITANPNRIGMKLTSCFSCFIKLPLFSFHRTRLPLQYVCVKSVESARLSCRSYYLAIIRSNSWVVWCCLLLVVFIYDIQIIIVTIKSVIVSFIKLKFIALLFELLNSYIQLDLK